MNYQTNFLEEDKVYIFMAMYNIFSEKGGTFMYGIETNQLTEKEEDLIKKHYLKFG